MNVECVQFENVQYLLQSERGPVPALFPTKEAIVKVSWGVVCKSARIH